MRPLGDDAQITMFQTLLHSSLLYQTIGLFSTNPTQLLFLCPKTEFYEHRKLRKFLVKTGKGGAKSSTSILKGLGSTTRIQTSIKHMPLTFTQFIISFLVPFYFPEQRRLLPEPPRQTVGGSPHPRCGSPSAPFFRRSAPMSG